MNKFELFILGWCELLTGLLSIVSFGFIRVGLDYKFVFWHAEREAKRLEQQNINQ